jgi:hypothetical protein
MAKQLAGNIDAFLKSFTPEQMLCMCYGEAAEMPPFEKVEFIAALLYDWFQDGSTRCIEPHGDSTVCVIKFWADKDRRGDCVKVFRFPIAPSALEEFKRRSWLEVKEAGHPVAGKLALNTRGRTQTGILLFD